MSDIHESGARSTQQKTNKQGSTGKLMLHLPLAAAISRYDHGY